MGASSSSSSTKEYSDGTTPLPPTTHEATNEFLEALETKFQRTAWRDTLNETEQEIKQYDFSLSLTTKVLHQTQIKYHQFEVTPEKTTFLHHAFRLPLEYWILFVSYGASMDAKDYRGISPYYCSVQLGRVDILRHFCTPERINTVDKEGNTILLSGLRSFPLNMWGGKGSKGIFFRHTEAIESACREYPTSNPDLRWLKMLLERKADPNIPNNDGDTPLLFIATNAKYPDNKCVTEVAALLLEYGANVKYVNERFNQCALVGSSDNCKFHLFSWLLAHGADFRSFVLRTTPQYPTPKIKLLLGFSSFLGITSEQLQQFFTEKGIIHLICSYFQLDIASLAGNMRPQDLPAGLY